MSRVERHQEWASVWRRIEDDGGGGGLRRHERLVSDVERCAEPRLVLLYGLYALLCVDDGGVVAPSPDDDPVYAIALAVTRAAAERSLGQADAHVARWCAELALRRAPHSHEAQRWSSFCRQRLQQSDTRHER